MPRIITMNGDHQSVATAPLDLSTTARGRRRSGTPDCNFCAKDARGTGGSPAPPASTGTDSSEIRCSPNRTEPGSESSGTRKRPADSCSSKLPFRKRPIPLEPDGQKLTPAPTVSGTRSSPGEEKDFSVRESSAARLDDSRVGVAPATLKRAGEAGQGPEGYPCCVFPISPILNYAPYPVYIMPPVSEPHLPLAHQTEHLLAGIALATRQDEDGDTALHIAVVQGEMSMVCKLIELLLWAHRDLDIYNHLRQTPLHLAVITKQAHMVDVLLRAGADPSVLDRHGQTALHLCCEYDQHDCLSVLVPFPSFSSCLEIRNFDGLTPLHLAVLQGHQNLAEKLLDAGADINAMDIKSGQSPLMHAVESNNPDMVHFLIENRCDVNSQSYSGNTALHIACGRGQVDTVRLLLKSGADSSFKNYHNDTPVMVAKNKKIADVLRGRGSKQIRAQDQYIISVSPHGTNYMENGSPSSSQSHGSSPSTTPHGLYHGASHSPKPPTAQFPFY
ncbi:B-cell lymphoma 3 protein homolog [Nematolebias whitei]|uniref:B-cell lymphoma 3 protein homolog n=1 Tax=Nematolebias whitei TaxID=451745 RepID=UPI0018973739|nr:B-cell lymphoma 3 protein homolog [Nematolebias whitei]